MKQPFIVNGNIEIEKNWKCFINTKRLELLKQIKVKGFINVASLDR
jgi:molybdenum-dependent DNA-binding transcriptional regulator ModE